MVFPRLNLFVTSAWKCSRSTQINVTTILQLRFKSKRKCTKLQIRYLDYKITKHKNNYGDRPTLRVGISVQKFSYFDIAQAHGS